MTDEDRGLILVAKDEKEVNKKSAEDKDGGSYYHTKLKAKNSDKVDWIKVKTTGEEFCEMEDEFKIEDIEGQTTLEDLTTDNDIEEEMN